VAALMADLPHFAFPFARGAYVEQDSMEHVVSCENVIVRCPVGFRVERPDYGVPWPDYATQIDGEVVAQALAALEPRSTCTAYTARDWLADAMATITIELEVDSG
jgi:phage baseplate assembly protein W